MNGRALLFNRCLIGVLAYFLCALANAAIFKDHETGALTGDPLGFTLSYAASAGYGSGVDDITDTCPKVPVGGGCRVSLWAKSSTSGVRILRGFSRIKEDPCQPKKGKSAGELLVPLPFSGVDGSGKPIVVSADGLNSFFKSRASSCDGTCELIMSGNFSNGDKLFAIASDKNCLCIIKNGIFRRRM